MEQLIKHQNINSPQWFIWYTKPRAEKQIFLRLQQKSVEVYLPLRKELRQWSDRKKWVETPLFNGYIFTHISPTEFDKIRYTEGILNYVRFDGKPATLRDEQIKFIDNFLFGVETFEVENSVIAPGELIEIIEGPLKGLSGELVSSRGKQRFAIRIEELGKVLLAELPKAYVKKK